MSVRDILDADGNVIGELELPEDAPESQWDACLDTYATPAPIPDVTPRQMRQALVLTGISIAAIETALDSLPEPIKTLARIEWEYSIAFQRNRPISIQVGTMLGKTSDEMDALWRFAASLP